MGNEAKTQKRQRRAILRLQREVDGKNKSIKVLEAKLKATESALDELEKANQPEPEDV